MAINSVLALLCSPHRTILDPPGASFSTSSICFFGNKPWFCLICSIDSNPASSKARDARTDPNHKSARMIPRGVELVSEEVHVVIP